MTQRERQILRMIEQDPMISQETLAEELGITRSSVAVHISNLIKKGCIAGRGYVLRTNNYVVVVGGANVDICGRSWDTLVPEDSNPGLVSMSIGGVGRNIAHNLSLLGADVRMLTAVGDDLNGQRLCAASTAAGIDMSGALRLGDERTSTYLYITGPDGDMALAVSDMTICERITPEYLAANRTLLENARAVVSDANIPSESLLWLAENCTVPLFVDPVSTVKAEKLRPILGRIHTLKPNCLEAELLSGIPIHDEADVEKAADRLLAMGIRRVFLSLGGDGMYAATPDGSFRGENFPCRMVNTTGCGDSAMAALVWAYLQDLDLKDTVRAALAAGSITIESPETISPQMSADALRQRML